MRKKIYFSDENSHQSQPSVSNSDTSASLQQQVANVPAPQILNHQQQHVINQQQQQQMLNQQQQPLYANAPNRIRSPACYSPTPEGAER